jgi:predicted nucleic acid-binding protein
MAISTGADEIIVSSIFEVEVVAALVRRGAPRSLAARFLEEHFGARNVVTLGPRAARSAGRVAALARLRAADAIYVWLAAREDVPLVTLDNEVSACTKCWGVRDYTLKSSASV